MDYFVFLLFLIIITLFAITPFFVLYGFSDIVSFLLYNSGYRKKVVRENLQNSFPGKSVKEIKQIEKNFYRNLSDIFLESIKGYTMSTKTGKKRYTGKNTDIIKKYHEEGRGVILALSHYANWEWGTVSLPLYVENDIAVVYKPIKNKYIDRFIKRSRSKNGMFMIPINQTRMFFQKFKDKPHTFILVSDQSPSNPDKSVWVDFLGRKTPFLHGIEYYSRVYNMPVIYMSVERKKRGYYEFAFSLLHDNPKELAPGKITEMYAEKVEEEIRKNPSNWLWSHRRWKHGWGDYVQRKKEQV